VYCDLHLLLQRIEAGHQYSVHDNQHLPTTAASPDAAPEVIDTATEAATAAAQNNNSEGKEDQQAVELERTEGSSMPGFISGAFAVLAGVVITNAMLRGVR
jgi:hypothetical protein